MPNYKKNQIVKAYRFDQHGHYYANCSVQVGSNLKPALPPDAVDFAPDMRPGYWYKLDSLEKPTKWIEIKKPVCAKDCLGIRIQHSDQCDYAIEMRKLFKYFTDNDSEHYKLSRDEGLTQYVEEIPPKTVEELKSDKEKEIDNEFRKLAGDLISKDNTVTSSLGFVADADQRSANNVQSLITLLNAQSAADTQAAVASVSTVIKPKTRAKTSAPTVQYRGADNKFYDLTKEQLQILLVEIMANGSALYTQKWQLQQKLAEAKTVDDVNALKVEFVMQNYAKLYN